MIGKREVRVMGKREVRVIGKREVRVMGKREVRVIGKREVRVIGKRDRMKEGETGKRRGEGHRKRGGGLEREGITDLYFPSYFLTSNHLIFSVGFISFHGCHSNVQVTSLCSIKDAHCIAIATCINFSSRPSQDFIQKDWNIIREGEISSH